MARLVLETPMGWLWASARDGRVTACSFGHPTRREAEAASAAAAGEGREDALLARLAEDLCRYFAGAPVNLSAYPVDVSAQPPFRRRALLAAREIPYGQVRTYGWLAAQAGRPTGARAAGQAMARNPVGLLVPCHRVVAAGGRIGGFGGGPAMKRALLQLEGVRFEGALVRAG
jgi:methylated-DNA-[protein]-cysteine S-methyltransferase